MMRLSTVRTRKPQASDDGLTEDSEVIAKRKGFLSTCYWTTPGDGKVQLCPGFDVYVYQQSLTDFRQQFGPLGARGAASASCWSKYSATLLAYLSGGWDVVIKDRRPSQGHRAILGPDVFRAVAGHIKELFGVENDMEHPVNRVRLAWSNSVSQVRPKTKSCLADSHAEKSQVFSEYLATCYWKTPGADKIPLHPGFEIYVYPAILEDLKTHYGPGTPHYGKDGWGRYASRLFVNLVGGWDNLMKYERPNVSIGRMMEGDFFYAMLGHLRELFKTKMTKREFAATLEGIFMHFRRYQYLPEPRAEAETEAQVDDCRQPETQRRQSVANTEPANVSPNKGSALSLLEPIGMYEGPCGDRGGG
ncbi:hypothetical protein RvY_06954 [Ramazzottius varieornatus]|uniref:Uncharacterized protein n=1 Tax=Ramazzottius varieornatus TaxID=947166 RepID=A0A1D1V9X9_RAMVA|nr:hypothetical protein RvY_06954 [Ramazzottius varieornatus]